MNTRVPFGVIRQLAMTLLKIEFVFVDIRLNSIDSLQYIRHH
jgi:hypothetical protein